jgi:nucleoside-diphosphate-sugar epimerase
VDDALAGLRGDLVVLGAGGKMGPTLARMACLALGGRRSVVAVARFSDARSREGLEKAGVRTVACDLLEPGSVRSLPDAGAVIYMPAVKFGTAGAEATTWATNSFLPGLVADRYRGVPHVVFSTGNVYPLVPVASGGATEETPPGPIGEYAQSVLGRERVFEHFSRKQGTPVAIFRLNYAAELRYGVPLDVALKVRAGSPVDLRMGHVNVIWQGDANGYALRCLAHAQSPPFVINVTGPETVSLRKLAQDIGERLDREPFFEGCEEETALLSNASKAHRLFGPPEVRYEALVDGVVEWVKRGGQTLGRPTHFQTRDGAF